jgi:H2-forming N5,N10-methylenetetrahydromethanopterin dehydrogenase-like enzyme
VAAASSGDYSVSANTVSANTVTANTATAAALRLHASRMNLGERERRVAGSFMSAHPAVPVVEVPALPEDVHDLAGLRRVGESFAVQG